MYTFTHIHTLAQIHTSLIYIQACAHIKKYLITHAHIQEHIIKLNHTNMFA